MNFTPNLFLCFRRLKIQVLKFFFSYLFFEKLGHHMARIKFNNAVKLFFQKKVLSKSFQSQNPAPRMSILGAGFQISKSQLACFVDIADFAFFMVNINFSFLTFVKF